MAVRTDDQLSLEIRLTQAGFDLLNAELKALVEVARPEALRRVHAAYESGGNDGSTEVSDARWEQDRVEMRIQRLEGQLRNAHLVTDTELRSDSIAVGHRVDVRRADGTDRSYVIVSPPESDPRSGRLSTDSPLGRALVGHAVGEVVILEQNEERITITGLAPATA